MSAECIVTSSTYVAIDPGQNGGVAWSDRSGVSACNMPDTFMGLVELLRLATDGAVGAAYIYIEKVVPFIPGGGASAMFVYGANVERIYNAAEIVKARHPGEILIKEITPKAWQAQLELGGTDRTPIPRLPPAPRPPKHLDVVEKKLWIKRHKAEHKFASEKFNAQWRQEISDIKANNDKAKRNWKNDLRDEAKRRFPQLKVSLKISDCLLILDAAIKIESGKLELK